METTPSIEKFLQEPRYLVFATVGNDGTPHQTIVWYEFKDGDFKISTTTDRGKYINALRDPKVSMLVYDTENNYRYVAAQGRVNDITTENAHDFIEHLSQRYMNSPYYNKKQDREKEDRVIITITPYHFYMIGL
jgi:PPOX class probable F420-dependent enzyme